MLIDGIWYNVETYRLRFRFTKRRALLLLAIGTLMLLVGLTVAHGGTDFIFAGPSGGGRVYLE